MPLRIDTGRQLFVDDFLIADTTLQRTFHKPRLHQASPVLRPRTEAELNRGVMPAAAMGSVIYDPQDELFKMWYLAGYDDGFAYAASDDGLAWHRPSLDVVPGTSRVLPPLEGYVRNGSTVCLDHDAKDSTERFKMFAFYRAGSGTWPRRPPVPRPPEEEIAFIFTSPDGIHWRRRGRTGPCGDNTALFYNPFRNVWTYSIRTFGGERGRMRSIVECADFVRDAAWTIDDVRDWLAVDALDRPDCDLQFRPELYKVDCVAYESLMLGLFGIYRGPPNHVAGRQGIPKIVDLVLGYSRDGIAWERPDRTAFLASSREEGAWNRGYLQPAGGVCLIVNDELRFYFSGFSGISPVQGHGPYAGGSTGLAIMRRDGFVSMDGPGLPMPPVTRTGSRATVPVDSLPEAGILTTRELVFSGRYLFVNANVRAGDLRVELLEPDGRTIEGHAWSDCRPVIGDSTRHAVAWQWGDDLSALIGRPLRMRFHLAAGELYAFWVSPDRSGASYGYVASGGPGFVGAIDTTGA